MPREGESTFFPAKVPSARRPAIFLKNGRLIVAGMGSAFSPLKNPGKSRQLFSPGRFHSK
ncbi:hypothetical protein CXU21_06340 [Akkermansia muciniphila]|nr:hypothetical protein CXU21_06340 [Akkermansia muciniphila]